MCRLQAKSVLGFVPSVPGNNVLHWWRRVGGTHGVSCHGHRSPHPPCEQRPLLTHANYIRRLAMTYEVAGMTPRGWQIPRFAVNLDGEDVVTTCEYRCATRDIQKKLTIDCTQTLDCPAVSSLHISVSRPITCGLHVDFPRPFRTLLLPPPRVTHQRYAELEHLNTPIDRCRSYRLVYEINHHSSARVANDCGSTVILSLPSVQRYLAFLPKLQDTTGFENMCASMYCVERMKARRPSPAMTG